MARLSLVVFIAMCRKQRQTVQQLLPLRTPAATRYRPSGKQLQLINPQVDARFEDSRIERHARNLRHRRHDVTLAGMPRTPERARRE